MAASEDLPPRVETLMDQLAEADRDLATDLLDAVASYTRAERRLVAGDKQVGHDVSNRLARIGRLELMHATLERNLERRHPR
jgi:uncharacterized membrane protein YccC